MNEETLKDILAKNLSEIRSRIEAHRRPGGGDVKLVVVTKTVGPSVIRALYELGVRDFGENRVRDAREKAAALALEDARWHMIGHLQRNKAAKAEGLFSMIHSVESRQLAEALSRRLSARGGTLDVLVQVNTTGEPQKSGLAPDEVSEFVAYAASLPGLRVRGLMTMARLSGEPEESRPAFRLLREILGALRARGVADETFCELSMGMSRDYEIAAEEGATILRVGTAVFEGLS